MALDFYGIPNCDTVKKARKWLDAQGIGYVFHDYKKEGADAVRLERWADAVGWERLLNRSGTTFRKLPEAERQDIDRDGAIALMQAHPSMIRRPVIETGQGILVGFREDEWGHALR